MMQAAPGTSAWAPPTLITFRIQVAAWVSFTGHLRWESPSIVRGAWVERMSMENGH